VTTTSTKSNPKNSVSADVTTGDDGLSERTWRISALAILMVGAFIRLYDLKLVPLHHDEGVNGNFLVTLVREGKYTYNPENYHGPTLYYFSAIIPWVMRFFGGRDFGDTHGLTTFNIRLVTVVFGIATIGLALMLRNRLGTVGALSAAGLIAISPGAVYLSRYFIHESLFIFFMLGIVVAALRYYDTSQTVYLILAAISAALMIATKETWIINGPVLIIALATTSIYFWLRGRFSKEPRRERKSDETGWLARLGGPVSVATVALIAFTVFIVVNVLFYSSFFSNYPKGVNDALRTLALWRKRTVEHAHPWYQYGLWLYLKEGITLILGGVGAAIALWRGKNRFAVFLALWSFGLLAAYSIAGMSISRLITDIFVHRTITEQTYKTPWITLNFIVPLALTAGYALNVFYEKLRDYDQKLFFLAPAALIVMFCGYQMYQLNFVHYDDDRYVYVYAHTRRETLVLLDQIDRIANQMKTGNETGIALLSPEYWPLPWYLRNYKRVGYYQKVVATTEPIVIAQAGVQDEEVENMLGAEYQKIDSATLNDPRVDPQKSPNGNFSLRPGGDLLLYVRRDVAK
jgi:uncharacterized protein (TIGR03663 family)